MLSVDGTIVVIACELIWLRPFQFPPFEIVQQLLQLSNGTVLPS